MLGTNGLSVAGTRIAVRWPVSLAHELYVPELPLQERARRAINQTANRLLIKLSARRQVISKCDIRWCPPNGRNTLATIRCH